MASALAALIGIGMVLGVVRILQRRNPEEDRTVTMMKAIGLVLLGLALLSGAGILLG
jgi:hypothetical protein